MVSENGALKSSFDSKSNEITWEWRRLHEEELNDLYC